ncbi:MAG: glucose-1-phosphate cytidylyltransferase [Chlamydiales bacterium]|jgi:glucose-1-phosphate cytidylyltransferase
MKTVFLAGGLGTRLSEKTSAIPKPMVEIGGKPIIWHIMNIYAAHGFKDFALALGYKAEVIKEYFLNFHALNNPLTIDLKTGKTTIHTVNKMDWTVQLVDTGDKTDTGGRVKRLQSWVGNETFMLTYGDGLADVNIRDLVAFHKSHGKLATITAVRPPARFGSLSFDGDKVTDFTEKPQTGEGWINGGFFVLEPEVFDYIEGDQTIWERGPLERLANEGQLMSFKHEGFWRPMDTLRDQRLLESLWNEGSAPWKIWNQNNNPQATESDDERVQAKFLV